MKGTFLHLWWRKVPFIHHSKGSDLTPDRIAHPSACAMNGAFVDLKCTNAPFMVDGRATPEPSRDGLLGHAPEPFSVRARRCDHQLRGRSARLDHHVVVARQRDRQGAVRVGL